MQAHVKMAVVACVTATEVVDCMHAIQRTCTVPLYSLYTQWCLLCSTIVNAFVFTINDMDEYMCTGHITRNKFVLVWSCLKEWYVGAQHHLSINLKESIPYGC